MWNYALFVPVAGALTYLAIKITQAAPVLPTRRAGSFAFTLWALSWLAVLMILDARPSVGLSDAFVLGRDVGYLAGSALFVALPFLAVLGVGLALRLTSWTQSVKRVTALSVAAIGWFFVPWLFFTGWIMGCVVLGYRSCL